MAILPKYHEKQKKMVTYFNRKDLVSFGNFLFQQIAVGNKQAFPNHHEHGYSVTHADIENWKHVVKDEPDLSDLTERQRLWLKDNPGKLG